MNNKSTTSNPKHLLTYGLCLLSLLNSVHGQPPELLLRMDSGKATSQDAELSTPGTASAVMRLNPEVIGNPKAFFQPGRSFSLSVYDGSKPTLIVEETTPTADGGVVIVARDSDGKNGEATFTLQHSQLTGTVRMAGRQTVRILPGSEPGTVDLRQVNTTAPGGCATGVFGFPLPSARPQLAAVSNKPNLPPADSLTEPTVVDVLFLYTPEAVLGEGNEEGIRQRVMDSLFEANHRLANSKVNVVLNPVHIGLIQYVESGDLFLDLERLVNRRAGLSIAHTLRHDYKADLVCMITEFENQGIAGYSWDITNPPGDPNTGFTVIRRIHLRKNWDLLAHELGHLLGCAHDREHASVDQNQSFYAARRPYIFGHRFVVEGVTYRDLMSYNPGVPLPSFSSPGLDLDGVPMGVAAPDTEPSDGARTVNETAPYVAQYRTAISRVEFARPQFVAAEKDGSVTLQLVRSGDLQSETRCFVSFDLLRSSARNLDFLIPDNRQVTFAAGQATAELTVTLLSDEMVEGAETVALSLTSFLGDHGAGRQGTAEILILDGDTPVSHSQIQFPDGPLAVRETEGEARVKVVYTGAVGETVELPYQTVDGTARAGQHYEGVSGTVQLQGGAAPVEIVVPLNATPGLNADLEFTLTVGIRTIPIRIVNSQRIGALQEVLGNGLNADGLLLKTMVDADGRILIWGNFSEIAGKPRTCIARLHPDGTLDNSFQPPEILLGHRRFDEKDGFLPGFTNAKAIAVQVQPDGKMIIAGEFARVDGRPQSALVRLNPDGSVDGDFGRNLILDGRIFDFALQPDGRIVIGGDFEFINGQRRAFVARLMADGSVDETFQPKAGPTSDWMVAVATLTLQPDGRILIGGQFQKVDGQPSENLARLNPDGTYDTSFKLTTGVSGTVRNIELDPQGRILISGYFDTVGGRTIRKLARLTPDGVPDQTFRAPNPKGDVGDLIPLPDGRILASGFFTSIGGLDRRFIALLKEDGTVDTDFDMGTGLDLVDLVDLFTGRMSIHGNGSLYLAGPFRRYNGLAAPSLVRVNLGELPPRVGPTRLENGSFAVQVHGFPGGVSRVETSPNLLDWQPAEGVRITGFDRTADLTVPASRGVEFFRFPNSVR